MCLAVHEARRAALLPADPPGDQGQGGQWGLDVPLDSLSDPGGRRLLGASERQRLGLSTFPWARPWASAWLRGSGHALPSLGLVFLTHKMGSSQDPVAGEPKREPDSGSQVPL